MQQVARLIHHFIPEHYQLSLNLDREGRVFSGTVTLNGTSPQGSEKILLHAKDLSIQSVTLDGKMADFSLDSSTDELTITHDDILAGKHVMVVAFSGTITDAMHGLYPCYYQHDGQKKELLATQFESHHAREVFPCIDEPEAKATFDVTLTTEPGISVLGNMPISRQTTENGRLVTTFDTTPRMSTYLLAWVAGDLHRKTATTADGVEVNVWATTAQKPESLDFALDVAVRTIEYFNDYFGTPYPLPKADHVALPDFTSGAMENWGLITYREVALLADPATVSISSKQYIALVIAHELSHQWFGNLVTMKWWNNLWLNESFATLMEYVAVDALFPKWNIWLNFSTMESILALRRDSIDGVQSVQTDVAHPDEIGTLFDPAIVYAKGARLLRMLQHHIGHEAFRQGLKRYFQVHAYQNTEGNDLWKALSDASGQDIATFMNAWITQPGYPVVSILSGEDKTTLTQKRFFIGSHVPSNFVWPIPLNASDPSYPRLLDAPEISLPTTSLSRLNIGDSAHFITLYNSDLLTKLITALHTFTPLDRLQLLHEQTLLVKAGEVSAATLIPLLEAYKDEDQEAVWDIMSLAIGELRQFVEDDPESESRLKALYVRLAGVQYARLGWSAKEGETEADSKLRATIIGMMLYGDDRSAIDEALRRYHTLSIEELDPELRSIILAAAIRHGNDSMILPHLINAYKSSSSADLKRDIASAITSTRNPEDISTILKLLKDETVIRPQDVTHWFVWTIRNRFGRLPTWQWLKENWEWIDTMFGGDKSFDAFPRYAASSLNTAELLEDYRAFFTPLQKEPALTRAVSLGISEISARVELIMRDKQAVRDALAKL